MLDRDEIDARIREYCRAHDMKFAPWQTAPWDVQPGPSVFPPRTAGAASWALAQTLRAQILAELEGGIG
jgi:hypothetical protein